MSLCRHPHFAIFSSSFFPFWQFKLMVMKTMCLAHIPPSLTHWRLFVVIYYTKIFKWKWPKKLSQKIIICTRERAAKKRGKPMKSGVNDCTLNVIMKKKKHEMSLQKWLISCYILLQSCMCRSKVSRSMSVVLTRSFSFHFISFDAIYE